MHSFILLVNNGKPECNFTHFFRDKLSLSVQNVSLKLPERYSQWKRPAENDGFSKVYHGFSQNR